MMTRIRSRFRSINKKISVSTLISLFLITGIAATNISSAEPGGKNLKVIPKNTDRDQIERIMYQYTRQLGVTCSYCHPDTKPGIFPVRVDFATDDLPEKKIARKMMMMTDRLNKKYFGFRNDYSEGAMQSKTGITCNSCHLGLTKPNSRFKIID